jgi:hypothetical protein
MAGMALEQDIVLQAGMSAFYASRDKADTAQQAVEKI